MRMTFVLLCLLSVLCFAQSYCDIVAPFAIQLNKATMETLETDKMDSATIYTTLDTIYIAGVNIALAPYIKNQREYGTIILIVRAGLDTIAYLTNATLAEGVGSGVPWIEQYATNLSIEYDPPLILPDSASTIKYIVRRKYGMTQRQALFSFPGVVGGGVIWGY